MAQIYPKSNRTSGFQDGPGVLLKTSVLLLDYLGKGSCFDLSISYICGDDNTFSRTLTFKKLETGRHRAVTKEPLPVSNSNRIYFQTELLNEIILLKGL